MCLFKSENNERFSFFVIKVCLSLHPPTRQNREMGGGGGEARAPPNYVDSVAEWLARRLPNLLFTARIPAAPFGRRALSKLFPHNYSHGTLCCSG